jgi:ribosomal protein S27E
MNDKFEIKCKVCGKNGVEIAVDCYDTYIKVRLVCECGNVHVVFDGT